MIKGGTTCFADMYFHEDEVAKAVEKSGLRGVLGEGIIEAGNRVQGEKMLARSVSFAEHFRGYADGRVSAMLAPHAVYSCSPELLLKVGEEASRLGVGLHLHLGESETMLREFEKKHRLSEVEFLNKIGLLNHHVLAAHCINLSEKDMRTLSNRKVNAAYVPVANMKLGLGAAKIKDLADLGVNVGLGTDGPASNNSLDLFETMKTGALLQKHEYLDPTVLPAYAALKMATLNGARAVGLEKDVGSLEVGKKADVILVDLAKPHLTPLHDIYSTIVYSARAADVDTVIVDGKILMQKRQVRSLDEQAVMEKARNTAYDLLSR
jgi:5-methylthioadenosine/S-adenosylhomocysteine deaminase